MRTFATLFTVGTLIAATLAQSIPFRKDLSCGACALGGYRFCYTGNNGECCDTVNDPTCANKYKDCTSTDKFKAVYGDCDRGNFRNSAVCGNNAVR
jgi:hypothetical protein